MDLTPPVAGVSVSLSLSNMAQFLLVTKSSVRRLHQVMAGIGSRSKGKKEEEEAEEKEEVPFSEDDWREVSIGSTQLQV